MMYIYVWIVVSLSAKLLPYICKYNDFIFFLCFDSSLGSNNLQCSGRGSCVCGLCSCQDGFFGTVCECDERDCNNQDLGLVCSGRGSCGCNGQCTCNVEPVTGQPYSGDLKVCECTPNQQNCRDPTNRTVSIKIIVILVMG